MEYSGLISLGGYTFEAYDGGPDTLLVAITAHEVAHQWWYGSVGNDQVQQAWLDDSLAMMSEILFYEQYFREFIGWWWFYRVERWDPKGTAVGEYQDSATFVHDMYGTASYFMEDLRTAMGPAVFREFLRTYYADHQFGWTTETESLTMH